MSVGKLRFYVLFSRAKDFQNKLLAPDGKREGFNTSLVCFHYMCNASMPVESCVTVQLALLADNVLFTCCYLRFQHALHNLTPGYALHAAQHFFHVNFSASLVNAARPTLCLVCIMVNASSAYSQYILTKDATPLLNMSVLGHSCTFRALHISLRISPHYNYSLSSDFAPPAPLGNTRV